MKVDTAVLRVLDEAELDGPHLRLVGQLDRKMYVETNKVLEAAGGKWNRSAKAHIFGGDAIDALDQILLTGEVATPQEFGFFESPPAVVERLLHHAKLEAGMAVLEPSAGCGAIARPVSAGCQVQCFEIQPKLHEELLDAGCESQCIDFLTVEPHEGYDRVARSAGHE